MFHKYAVVTFTRNISNYNNVYFPPFFNTRQEALEAALSEKDAHLALLEVTGVKNAKQADQLEKLRADRSRLTLRLQVEVIKEIV